jgi:hypothetical protein
MNLFDCEDMGPMEEYIGSKVQFKQGKLKLTQLVLVQSFVNEFGVEKGQVTALPAKSGQIPCREEKDVLDAVMHTKFRSDKLRYPVTWSRPEILK